MIKTISYIYHQPMTVEDIATTCTIAIRCGVMTLKASIKNFHTKSFCTELAARKYLQTKINQIVMFYGFQHFCYVATIIGIAIVS